MLSRFHILVFNLLLLLIITASPLHAQLPQVSSGLSYLVSSQNPDGSWETIASLAEKTTTTVTALETLKLLNQTAGTTYSTGAAWLQAQSIQGVDPIAGRIRALSIMSSSADTLIPLLDPLSGAWGGDYEYETVNLDTTLALKTLKTVNYPDQAIITSAISYLISTQNPDGGWGFSKGDDSNIYVTAIISSTLQQIPQTPIISTTLNKATTFLLARQNADGGFGNPSSTIHETAVAYNALIAVITDSTALGKAISFLTANQSADGSWLQDPYSTALALQALYYSEYKPTPPLPPTTGTLAGKVVSVATNQPLAGVTVSLAVSPAIAATTDGTGVFKLDNIPQGAQQITLALSGYSTASLVTTVTAGGISNLGTLTLAIASPSGTVQGVITDEATGAPLAGVLFEIYMNPVTPGFAAITSANGTFKIVDIPPETYVMSASKAGYNSINWGGKILAGGVFDFSPALSTKPVQSTVGEVMGRVVDDSTSAPIAGAIVTITGKNTYTTTTNANGDYHISNIEPVSATLFITASGYYEWYSPYYVSIPGGVISYQGIKKLSKAPISTTVNGKVIDSITNLPVAGAEISVTGTSLTAKTDASGAYTIQGINQLIFELKTSAPGYFGKSLNLTNQYHGAYTVDFSLVASRAVNTGIVSVSTDKTSYQAYADVAISADILNTDTLPVTIAANVTVMNTQGDVLASLPVTELDANGVAGTQITFQPGITKTVSIKWNTSSRPPGDYSVIVKILDDSSLAGLDAIVIAQQSHKFTIEPTEAIDTLTLTPLPKFTNLNATEQIGIQSNFVNRSNVPTQLFFNYDWKGPDGAILHSGSGSISAQPEETSKSILLESFPFTFTSSGDHPLQVQIASGPIPFNLAGGTVSVAPGIRIEPSQSLAPATVTPDSDKRIHMNIRLKGVVSK